MKYEKFLLENNQSAPAFELRLRGRELQKNLFDYIGAGTSNTTDLRIGSTGNTNETKLTAGTSSYALVDTQILINRTRSSAEDSYTVGTTNVVNNAAITVDVVGDDIDITLVENSSSTGSDKTTDIDIATDSDDVDIAVTHTGAGAHKTKLLCTGSCAGSDFTMSQTIFAAMILFF